MCSPQALLALQTAKAITSTIGSIREARNVKDVSTANIANIQRATQESLQNLVDQTQETRGEIIKNLDRSLSRISVSAAESGFTGVTKARIEKGVAARVQLDLNALRRNKQFAIQRLNVSFQQNVLKQNLNIIEAGARRDTAILTGVAEIGIAGIGFKNREEIEKKIVKQKELAGKK